jgi:Ca2+-binding RTX toxin-like protein
MTATAAFDPITGALTVSDNISAPSDNDIVVSFEGTSGNAAVIVTDGGIRILSGTVPTHQIRSIVVATGDGNDKVSLSYVGSAQFTQLWQVPIIDGGAGNDTILGSQLCDLLYGVSGDDTIIGLESGDHLYGGLGADRLFGDYGSNHAQGSGADFLYGEIGADVLIGDQGNDTLLGFAGDDLLFGRDGDDTLLGMDGNDSVFGEAGNDRMFWYPSDGTDVHEGGAGIDTTEVNGTDVGDLFAVAANGSRVSVNGSEPDFSIDIGTTEKLVVNAKGGDDSFSATGDLPASIHLTVNGGAGNDTILGSNRADELLGGDGNDFIDGNQGDDLILMGSGDDSSQVDPGDGNDVLNGQAGTDKIIFNGSDSSDDIELSSSGDGDSGLNSIEQLEINALGGADDFIMGDVSGEELLELTVDLAGVAGSGIADGLLDSVTINGSPGADDFVVASVDGIVTVLGLSAVVRIKAADPTDRLRIIADAQDTVDASALEAGVIDLAING